ncbi:MAG: transposase [Phycisphaerales bacterium]|nr:transposase [Phycisphaerales bacterium]
MTLQLATTSPAAGWSNRPASGSTRWFDIESASHQCGLSQGHLRRLCGDQWLACGKARMGAQGRWEISADAHPRLLLAGRQVTDDQVDLAVLTNSHRAILLQREEICMAWHVFRMAASPGAKLADIAGPFVDQWRLRGVEFSIRTLHRWYGEWTIQGRKGVIDRRAKNAAKAMGECGVEDHSNPFYEALKDWYLAAPPNTKRTAYKLARRQAAKAGWPVVSYGQAARYLRKLNPAQVTAARRGNKAFDDLHAAYTDRDYTRFVPLGEVERDMQSNDLWCGDHHECDVIVRAGQRIDHRTGETIPIYRRPWLTAWQDVHSRRIVGWLIRVQDPNATAVIESLVNAIDRTDNAVPRMVLIDNGKDYDSFAVQGVTKQQRFKLQRRKVRVEFEAVCAGALKLIGAHVQHALPFNAKSKPIERWFGTFEDQFGRLWPTYCGNTPQNKPQALSDILAAGTQVPTLEQFIEAAGEYIEQVFHHQVHTGQGMNGRTPSQVYDQDLVTKLAITDPIADLLRHKMGVPVRVGRNGVSVRGVTYGRNDPILRDHHGQEVVVAIDTRDVSRAVVWSPAGELIGSVAAHKLMPFGAVPETQWLDVERQKKRHNKALKQVRKHGLRVHPDALAMLVESKLQEARQASAQAATPPKGPRPPHSVKMVRTGLEEQLAAMKSDEQRRERMQLRPAVGAEHVAAMDDFYRRAAEDEMPSDDGGGAILDLWGES